MISLRVVAHSAGALVCILLNVRGAMLFIRPPTRDMLPWMWGAHSLREAVDKAILRFALSLLALCFWCGLVQSYFNEMGRLAAQRRFDIHEPMPWQCQQSTRDVPGALGILQRMRLATGLDDTASVCTAWMVRVHSAKKRSVWPSPMWVLAHDMGSTFDLGMYSLFAIVLFLVLLRAIWTRVHPTTPTTRIKVE